MGAIQGLETLIYRAFTEDLNLTLSSGVGW